MRYLLSSIFGLTLQIAISIINLGWKTGIGKGGQRKVVDFPPPSMLRFLDLEYFFTRRKSFCKLCWSYHLVKKYLFLFQTYCALLGSA
jgi:hypothetical protein